VWWYFEVNDSFIANFLRNVIVKIVKKISIHLTMIWTKGWNHVECWRKSAHRLSVIILLQVYLFLRRQRNNFRKSVSSRHTINKTVAVKSDSDGK